MEVTKEVTKNIPVHTLESGINVGVCLSIFEKNGGLSLENAFIDVKMN